VNLKVMDIVKNFATKMIGIDSSGGIDINYSPAVIDVILRHAELRLFKLPSPGNNSSNGSNGSNKGSDKSDRKQAAAAAAGKAALKPAEYEKALENTSSCSSRSSRTSINSSNKASAKKTVSVHVNIRTLTGLEFYIYQVKVI
jgi:hypothetical protein